MPSIGWLERNFKIYGIHLYGRANPTPGPGSSKITFHNPPEWTRGDFFDVTAPTRVTVPHGYRGRYTIRLTLEWTRGGNMVFTELDREQGFFYGELSTNAHPDGVFHESRVSAAPVVHSTRTVLHLLWEGMLTPGDFIEPNIQYTLAQITSVNAWFRMRRLGK
jgi:hypothetical protein